jgi:hypothetical protein
MARKGPLLLFENVMNSELLAAAHPHAGTPEILVSHSKVR